jgi:hypothetical protein
MPASGVYMPLYAKDQDLNIFAVPLPVPAPRNRTGCGSCTRGIPIALTPRSTQATPNGLALCATSEQRVLQLALPTLPLAANRRISAYSCYLLQRPNGPPPLPATPLGTYSSTQQETRGPRRPSPFAPSPQGTAAALSNPSFTLSRQIVLLVYHWISLGPPKGPVFAKGPICLCVVLGLGLWGVGRRLAGVVGSLLSASQLQ